MRRATGTETEGERQELKLINGLEHHGHRPLEDFVLHRRQANRPVFLVVLRHIRALDRRRLVATVFGPREQVPQIPRQVLAILCHRPPVDSRRGVFADAPVGFVHPVQVHRVVKRRQRLVRVPLRHQLYAPSSGGHAFHGLGSPARFRRRYRYSTTALATHGLPRVGFPAFQRYYAAAKTASVRLCTFAWPLGARYLGTPAVFADARPRGRRTLFRTLFHRVGPRRFSDRGGRRLSRLPVRPLCDFALFSDPGWTLAPDPDGATVRPPLLRRRRLQRFSSFRGSITRLCRPLPTLEGALAGR